MKKRFYVVPNLRDRVPPPVVPPPRPRTPTQEEVLLQVAAHAAANPVAVGSEYEQSVMQSQHVTFLPLESSVSSILSAGQEPSEDKVTEAHEEVFWRDMVVGIDVDAREKVYHPSLKVGGAGWTDSDGTHAALRSWQPSLQNDAGNSRFSQDPALFPTNVRAGVGAPIFPVGPLRLPSQHRVLRRNEKAVAEEATFQQAVVQLNAKAKKAAFLLERFYRAKAIEAGLQGVTIPTGRALGSFGPKGTPVMFPFMTRLRRKCLRTWQVRYLIKDGGLDDKFPGREDIVPGIDFIFGDQYLSLPSAEDRLEYMRGVVPASLWEASMMLLHVPRPHGGTLVRQRYLWQLAQDEAFAMAQTKDLPQHHLDLAASVAYTGGGMGFLPRFAKKSVASRVAHIPEWYNAGRRPVPPDIFAEANAAKAKYDTDIEGAVAAAMWRPRETPAHTFNASRAYGFLRVPADRKLKQIVREPRNIAERVEIYAGLNPGATGGPASASTWRTEEATGSSLRHSPVKSGASRRARSTGSNFAHTAPEFDGVSTPAVPVGGGRLAPVAVTLYHRKQDHFYAVPGVVSQAIESKRPFNKLGVPVGRARAKELTQAPTFSLNPSKSLTRLKTVLPPLPPGDGDTRSPARTLSASQLPRNHGMLPPGTESRSAPQVLPFVGSHPTNLEHTGGIDLLHTMAENVGSTSLSSLAFTGSSHGGLGVEKTCYEEEVGQAKNEYRDLLLGLAREASGWMTRKPHVWRELVVMVRPHAFPVITLCVDARCPLAPIFPVSASRSGLKNFFALWRPPTTPGVAWTRVK